MCAKYLRVRGRHRTLLGMMLVIFFTSGTFFFYRASMAANVTWDGGGATNNWTDAANWSNNRVPTASDIAIFNSTSSKPVVISTNITVGSINMTTGFTGTVTQQGAATITTATNGDITIGAGTFQGGSGQIFVADQFRVAGGVFNSTSDALIINGGDFTVASGTFNPGTGRVEFRNAAITYNVNVSQVMNNVVISPGNGAAVTVSSGDTMIVNGRLELVDGLLNTGTVSVRGDVAQASTFDGGSSPINFDSMAVQTYTVQGGVTPALRFDAPDDAADHVTFTGPATVTSATITSTFGAGAIPLENPDDHPLTFRLWSQLAGMYDASAQSEWYLSDFDRTGGTFLPPAAVTANGPAATWDVATNQTWRQFTVAKNTGALLTIASGDVHLIQGSLSLLEGVVSGGTFQALGDVTVADGYDGGSTILSFSGTAVQTFDLGTASQLYNADIAINKTGGEVVMASSLMLDAANQDLTVQRGTFNLNGQNLFIIGTGGRLSVLDTGEFKMWGSEAITLNAGQPSLSTGSTVTYIGDNDDAPSTFPITTFKNVYSHLKIDAADGEQDVFTLGASLDVNGNFNLINGTLDVGTNNYPVTVAGNWSNTGALQARSGTVTLDGVNQIVEGETTFYNLTKATTRAATLTFPAGLTQTITGALTLQGSSTTARLSLVSSVSGTQANVLPQGAKIVRNVSVKDIANTHTAAFVCSVGCVNAGNVTGWEFPMYTLSAISGNTTEAGGTATYTLVLNAQPTANVVFTLASSDPTEGIPTSTTVTFTTSNWSTPRSITVRGVDDTLGDGDITYSITNAATSTDPRFRNLPVGVVNVVNVDNDYYGVEVIESDGTTNVTEGSASDTYTLRLRSLPTSTVTVTIRGDEDVTTDVSQAVFTPLNWNVPQTVTVRAVLDGLAEGAHTGRVQHSVISTDTLYNAIAVADVVANITNSEIVVPPPPPQLPAVSLVSPVGGERFTAGDVVQIRWTTNRSRLGFVNISLSFDGGLTYASITDYRPNFDVYDWTVPDIITTSARVRVQVTDGIDFMASAYSVANFEIVARTGSPTPPPPPTPPPTAQPSAPGSRGGTGYIPPTAQPSAPDDGRTSPGAQPSAPDSERTDSEPQPGAEEERDSSGAQPAAPNDDRGTQEAQPSAPETEREGQTAQPRLEVKSGDKVRTRSSNTVYMMDAGSNGALIIRPFMNAQIFFTYESSFDSILTLSEEQMALYPVGSPVLPKAGVTLVKFATNGNVYMTQDAGGGVTVLRWITTEQIALDMYGPAWTEYVIDLPDTLFNKYLLGEPLEQATEADQTILKRREDLRPTEFPLSMAARAGRVAGAVSERFIDPSVLPQQAVKWGANLLAGNLKPFRVSSWVAQEVLTVLKTQR